MSLTRYKAKRNFKRTAEPTGKEAKGRRGALRYVIQKHDASRLHYDFRLEMEGVLKSWAVPKGMPVKKGDRRLAVEVEDHPIEYASFEGTIAPGNYGAGTVMVWDKGTYEVLDDTPEHGWKVGKLHLNLSGEKLNGKWTLVRMRDRDSDKHQWLMLKSESDMKPLSKRREDESVVSHRSMNEIARVNDAQWESNRSSRASAREDARPTVEMPSNTRGLPKHKPAFVSPMKCELVSDLPQGNEWLYEIKFDGIRAIAIKTGKNVKLVSRSAKDLKYPQVAEAVAQLPCKECVLDGEIVAVDEQGRSSFQLLQSYNTSAARPPILYYAFDLLNLEGREVTALPLMKRKALLENVTQDASEILRFSAGIEGESKRVVKEMQSRGLEGLIAKRRDSIYEPGRRCRAWEKFKWTNEQEFVIGGYTKPKGARMHFGAILVGYYRGDELTFASKVGTGFDGRLLESLFAEFRKFETKECPFANLPEAGSGRGRLGAAEMRRCAWIKPKLVCEIRFAEWTRDGHLRQPVFLGLREDKRAEDVVKEVLK